MKNIITKVLKDSIAAELDLRAGDELVYVNNCEIKDYIDYKYQISDEEILLSIRKQDGELWEFEIEKEYDDDLGIVFQNPLMDNIKVCSNNCIFCFIDQMPKGMRKTLYLKDDDTRLSFLYGNFITLTNLSDDEIDRIIKYRISPVKVSVHATDLGLRNFMLGNNNSKDIIKYLTKLTNSGITVDCQIVLMRDINDKNVLNKTITDLAKLHPKLRSIAVVPVGLTKYRDNLYDLKSFDRNSSSEVITQISKLQKQFLNTLKTRFVFIADEFYVTSEVDFPEYKYYESFDQIENGIGMCRLLEWQTEYALRKLKSKTPLNSKCTIVTGYAAYDFMVKLTNRIMEYINIEISVVKIKNNFFGEKITVSGLVTGKDIIDQMKNKGYTNILLPENMVNDESRVFLDDITIEELKKELCSDVRICSVNGHKLLNKIMH